MVILGIVDIMAIVAQYDAVEQPGVFVLPWYILRIESGEAPSNTSRRPLVGGGESEVGRIIVFFMGLVLGSV